MLAFGLFCFVLNPATGQPLSHRAWQMQSLASFLQREQHSSDKDTTACHIPQWIHMFIHVYPSAHRNTGQGIPADKCVLKLHVLKSVICSIEVEEERVERRLPSG